MENSKKIKRKTLTGLEKKRLCQEKEKNSDISNVKLSEKYNISANSVSDILSKKNYWLLLKDDSVEARYKRKHTPGFPDIEQALAIWAECAIRDNQHLDGETLKEKAQRFAELFNITKFPASDGWLSNFKKRHNLHSYKKQGEANLAPIDQ